MNELYLNISMDPSGCYFVDANGLGKCVITFTINPDGEKCATMSFAGVNQAFLTFDASGSRVVSHMMFNPSPSQEITASVNNIIGYLNNI